MGAVAIDSFRKLVVYPSLLPTRPLLTTLTDRPRREKFDVQARLRQNHAKLLPS